LPPGRGDLGVGILSKSVAARHHDRVTALVIDDVTTPVLLALIWNPTPNPKLREMIRHGQAAFSQSRAHSKYMTVLVGAAR
jgi:hypothetical protein